MERKITRPSETRENTERVRERERGGGGAGESERGK